MPPRNRRSRSHPNGQGHAAGHAPREGRRLADEAEEMAVRLECAKLSDEELPLGVAYARFLDPAHRA